MCAPDEFRRATLPHASADHVRPAMALLRYPSSRNEPAQWAIEPHGTGTMGHRAGCVPPKIVIPLPCRTLRARVPCLGHPSASAAPRPSLAAPAGWVPQPGASAITARMPSLATLIVVSGPAG